MDQDDPDQLKSIRWLIGLAIAVLGTALVLLAVPFGGQSTPSQC
jgi:hypothetical protein